MSSFGASKRRLIGDLRLLKQHPENYFDAVTDQENMHIWYFLLTNFKDCAYEGGYYLGKLLLSEDYPFKAGNIQMMTPSGRFEIGKNICVTATAYHQSEYNVTWNIKSLIIGFHSIMMSDDNDNYGIAHIRLSNTSVRERERLAKESVEYNRRHNMKIFKMFERFVDKDGYPLKTIVMPNKTEPLKQSTTTTTATESSATNTATFASTYTSGSKPQEETVPIEELSQQVTEIKQQTQATIIEGVEIQGTENQIENKVENKVENQVENKVENQVENKVENQVEIQIHPPTPPKRRRTVTTVKVTKPRVKKVKVDAPNMDETLVKEKPKPKPRVAKNKKQEQVVID